MKRFMQGVVVGLLVMFVIVAIMLIGLEYTLSNAVSCASTSIDNVSVCRVDSTVIESSMYDLFTIGLSQLTQ